MTNTGKQSSAYSARLARINPEKLSQLSGDDSLKYLKKNFTAVKADEINKFFEGELKGMNNPAEKQAKIKEILNQFTNQASRNNNAKSRVMTNINTFTKSAAAKSRINRTKRSNNLAQSLSSARAALNTGHKRTPYKTLSEEQNSRRTPNPNYSSGAKQKQSENIYAQIDNLPKTPLELENKMKRIAPPLPPPRRRTNKYETIIHTNNIKRGLEQMKTVQTLTAPGGLYS